MRRLLVFVILVLLFQLFFVYLTTHQKQTITPKAQVADFFGFNIHSLGVETPENIAAYLSFLQNCQNASVVRFWGFINSDDNVIKKVLDAPSSMKFIITLSNFYKDPSIQKWPAPQGSELNWFKKDYKTNGMRDYIIQVTKKFGNHPKVLGWEIMNEPNCTADDACTQAQHQFLDDISTIIAQNSPGKLISAGTQAQNTGGEHFENGDFEKIINLKNINAGTCHLYPDGANAVENCLTAARLTKAAGKTFYIGEMGIKGNCTSTACANTCDQTTLTARADSILNYHQQFKAAGSDGFLVWQFSPERNAALYCDGSSIFPGDPLCGGKTLVVQQTQTQKTQTQQQQQRQTEQITAGSAIDFNPQNPTPNAPFKVVASSLTGFVWVHLKIFAQDNKLVWEAPKDGTQPKISKTGNTIQWVYDTKGLSAGDYKVIFYINCHTGCQEAVSRSLSIETKKTNASETAKGPETTATVTVGKKLTLFKVDFPSDIKWETAEVCDQINENNLNCQISKRTIETETVTLEFSSTASIKGFCAKKTNQELICYVLF